MKIFTTSAACLALMMAPLSLIKAATSMEDLEKMESWSYIHNVNYAPCDDADAKSFGCCGKPEDGKERCGPDNWIHINETTTTTCANVKGNQQSPINIQTVGTTLTTMDKADGTMSFSGHTCEAFIEFKEGTWEVVIPDTCTFQAKIGGTDYKLLQFHFHNAEHSINFSYMPLEVHLVHAKVDSPKDIAVLSVFLAPGASSTFFEALQANDAQADPDHPDLATKNKINAYDILPEDHSFWHYVGSLTTPPCQTEKGQSVNWYLFKTPNTLSYSQLYFFTSYFRDLPLSDNGRISRDTQDVVEGTTLFTFP
ncbi:hypothetical protein NSK_006614 [Nannochloropsis salina CCMP1776]|uniref:carbonic anhydrase n=1 Tax=Nannochloropsis salina CCMP1776 TaxID=1027361 RepID=A0A4D9CSY6_9STRA|nr:hypothetical protein NSK_006614 [Nannochloropsis salina CCMP1776]|eukprot:TFJ81946.1 hypothetical protein NSK_006614 [Nannochloropsis salina CCMP1776]